MTPIQTMNKFEEKYQYINETYLQMQQTYVSKKVKGKLFTTSQHVANSDRQAHMQSSISEYEHDDLRLLGLHLFGTWRNSLNIFCLDEDIANEVVSSDIPNEITSDVLKNLPSWCVYIEIPRQARAVFTDSFVDEDSIKLLGFWATYDTHASGAHIGDHLSLFLHIDDNGKKHTDLALLKPVTLPIGDISITQSINSAWGYKGCTFTSKVASNKAALRVLVSILLCLCVDNPDVVNVIGQSLSRKQLDKPIYKHVKRTNAFTPPSQPHYYEIGLTLGIRLRRCMRDIENKLAVSTETSESYLQKGSWQVLGVDEVDTYWQAATHFHG